PSESAAVSCVSRKGRSGPGRIETWRAGRRGPRLAARREGLMPQLTRCPHCSQVMNVPDVLIGKQVRCPTCKKAFLFNAVPAREPVAAVASPTAPSVPPPPPPPSARPPPPPPPTPSKVTPAPTVCPACKATLLPGAIACMDCGYLLQSEGSSVEVEG